MFTQDHQSSPLSSQRNRYKQYFHKHQTLSPAIPNHTRTVLNHCVSHSRVNDTQATKGDRAAPTRKTHTQSFIPSHRREQRKLNHTHLTTFKKKLKGVSISGKVDKR